MSSELFWHLIIGGSILLLILIIFIVFFLKNKIKRNLNFEFPGWLEALGGSNNISNVTLKGSRVNLNFENKANINKEFIKENGVQTVVISNKKITLVIGEKADQVYKYLINNQKEA